MSRPSQLPYGCWPADGPRSNIVVAPVFEKHNISLDDPITLKEACKMFFRGAITVASLRAEQRRGNLNTFKIGRTIFTTPRDLQEMQKKCRVERKHHASTLTKIEGNGLSETDRHSSALAALSQTVNELKNGSPNTSEPSTGQRRLRRR